MTDATTTSTAEPWPELSFDELMDSFKDLEDKMWELGPQLVRIEMSPDVYEQVVSEIEKRTPYQAETIVPYPLVNGVRIQRFSLYPPGTILPVYRNRDGTETYGQTKVDETKGK